MLQPPERTFEIRKGEHAVLRGDFLSGMEYRALTGSSFEEAWDSLRPQLLEHELAKAEGREPKRVVDRYIWDDMFMDLFFAFSASWRRECRWDQTHREEDDTDREPRWRGPYVAFAKLFHNRVLVKLRVVVFGLLNDALSDPTEADAEGASDRPNDEPETPNA